MYDDKGARWKSLASSYIMLCSSLCSCGIALFRNTHDIALITLLQSVVTHLYKIPMYV